MKYQHAWLLHSYRYPNLLYLREAAKVLCISFTAQEFGLPVIILHTGCKSIDRSVFIFAVL